MPNTGDFYPAKAIQGARQQRAAEEAKKAKKRAAEEVAKQRAQAQRDLQRADDLKLLRYADEQLEEIRNPIVSEFVVTERWATKSWWRGYKQHRRQTRYYGSWLSLTSTRGPMSGDASRSGLVNLRRPRTCYAYVRINEGNVHINEGSDPRNVGHINVVLTDAFGRRGFQVGYVFRIFASLEEATEAVHPNGSLILSVGPGAVAQALDFVATGQPPNPTRVESGWQGD